MNRKLFVTSQEMFLSTWTSSRNCALGVKVVICVTSLSEWVLLYLGYAPKYRLTQTSFFVFQLVLQVQVATLQAENNARV